MEPAPATVQLPRVENVMVLGRAEQPRMALKEKMELVKLRMEPRTEPRKLRRELKVQPRR